MQINIRSQNIKLKKSQEEYIEKKMTKLVNYASRIDDESTEIRVEIDRHALHSNQTEFKIQVTMYVPHAIIRAEKTSPSIEGAVDEVEIKLKRQIERYKAKQYRHEQKEKWVKEMPEETSATGEESAEEFEIPKIIRRKRFSKVIPMTEEEAINQMELLEHTFFLFQNADTNRFSLVYKRKDGYYGIIEPHIDEDLK